MLPACQLFMQKTICSDQNAPVFPDGDSESRMSSLLTFNLFSKDPQRYVPVNNGNCPVAQLDRHTMHPGDPK